MEGVHYVIGIVCIVNPVRYLSVCTSLSIFDQSDRLSFTVLKVRNHSPVINLLAATYEN